MKFKSMLFCIDHLRNRCHKIHFEMIDKMYKKDRILTHFVCLKNVKKICERTDIIVCFVENYNFIKKKC